MIAAPADMVAVGIGELAVSSRPDIVLTTHALGSCVAVCIWDPIVHVAGLLHFLLPDSAGHTARAAAQPAAFADRGIPLLFETAYRHGLRKHRATVNLIGAAERAAPTVPASQIARRNLLAARKLLWANGVLIAHEETGGRWPRSVYLSASTGQIHVKAGHEQIVIG